LRKRGLGRVVIAGALAMTGAATATPSLAGAAEIDMFASLVAKLGEPERARKVPAEEIAVYDGVLPGALLRFWADHGRGSYQEGAFWICDPRPFGPILREIFAGDAEFDAGRMSVVGYTAFGTMLIWDRVRKQVQVSLLTSTVFNVPAEYRINGQTEQPFSDDFTIATFIVGMRYFDEPLFRDALHRLGRLDEGEIYGFVPALQLGGAFVSENIHRMRLLEHASFIVQLEQLKLTRLTPPEPPHFPYGRTEVIRALGPAEPRR